MLFFTNVVYILILLLFGGNRQMVTENAKYAEFRISWMIFHRS